MNEKNIHQMSVEPPTGSAWLLKKLLEKTLCWGLKTRLVYDIISKCLEKEGKTIMLVDNIKENFETLIRTSKESNKELKKLEKLEKRSEESREKLEKLEKLEKDNKVLKAMMQQLLDKVNNK